MSRPCTLVCGLFLSLGLLTLLPGCAEEPFASTGYIRIVSKPDRVLYASDLNEPLTNYEAYANSMVSILQSDRIIKLALEHEAMAGYRKIEGIASLKEGGGIEAFRSHLKVEHPANSEGIKITYTDPDGERARKSVKALIDAFMQLHGEKEVQSVASRMSTLETLRSRYRDKIDSIQARVIALSLEFGTPEGLNRQYMAAMEQTQRVEQAVLEARIEQARHPDASAEETLARLEKVWQEYRRNAVEIAKKVLTVQEFLPEEADARQKLREVTDRIEELNIEQQTAGRIKVISEGSDPVRVSALR